MTRATPHEKMQICQCKVRPLQAPLDRPFRTALGQHDTLDNLLFTVKLKNGITGYGEAAVATHITGETLAATQKNLVQCGQKLCGRSVADYLHLSKILHQELPANKAALAAIEMAILDALTRSLKIPLWRLFGNKPAKLHTDITIVIDDLKNTQKKTLAFYRQGFRAFKVKIGQDMDQDLRRVIAVSAIAKRSKLYLDANQGYNAQQTLRFLKELEKYDIVPDLLEQPVPRSDREGLKKVTRLARSKVCADESVKDLKDAAWAIKEKACDVINIKLMKSGLIQAAEIALLAKAHRMGLMIGGMMESDLAMTCSAHLAAGLRSFDYVDLDTPFFLKHTRKNPFLSQRGEYDLRTAKSGIGITP